MEYDKLNIALFQCIHKTKMKTISIFLVLLLQQSQAVRLLRRELTGYSLAKCNDGTTASYFYDQVPSMSQSDKKNDKVHYQLSTGYLSIIYLIQFFIDIAWFI